MIVVLAIALALGIQAVIVKPYQIPSQSMEPTLDVGQRVLVNRLGYHFGSPGIGDVVVFHPPQGADSNQCGAQQLADGGSDDSALTYSPNQPCPFPTPERSNENFIKRVVAEPGDRLRIEDGRPVVNGEVLEEDYIRPCGAGVSCTFDEEIVIPPDHYFMMGDNRGASDDSRFWGPVPRDWIIGRAFLTYWPPSRWGFL